MTPPSEVGDLITAVGLPPATLRRGDVERQVGMSHEEMVRWWRAMGFAEVPEDELAFGEDDVRMAVALAGLLDAGSVEDRDVLRLARVLGASFSRIAEAQVDLLDHVADASTATPVGGPPTVADPELLEVFEASLVYVWRRHLLAALGRRVQLGSSPAEDVVDPSTRPDAAPAIEGRADDDGAAPEDRSDGDHMHDAVTIGFVDITGFSKMSKTLAGDALADIIDSFEADALEVVGDHGGRVVKFIGDAVMFVADDLASGIEIGLDLQVRGATSEPPVELHCGVAHGPGVTMGGDVFGPTVNLASRLTDVARRGTVVVPRDCVDELDGVDGLAVRPVRRSYDLRGIGRTRLATVTRAPVEVAGDEERPDDQRERDRTERRERRERDRAERRGRKERERAEAEVDRHEDADGRP